MYSACRQLHWFLRQWSSFGVRRPSLIELLFYVGRRPISPSQNLHFFSGRAWTGLQHWQCVTFIHFSIHSFMRLADAFIQSDLTLYFRDRSYQFMHSLGIWMFCVSVLQADQLMFALHFVKGMNPDLFQENVSVCVSHNESWRNDNVTVLARLQQRLWQDRYVVISRSSKTQ